MRTAIVARKSRLTCSVLNDFKTMASGLSLPCAQDFESTAFTSLHLCLLRLPHLSTTKAGFLTSPPTPHSFFKQRLPPSGRSDCPWPLHFIRTANFTAHPDRGMPSTLFALLISAPTLLYGCSGQCCLPAPYTSWGDIWAMFRTCF